MQAAEAAKAQSQEAGANGDGDVDMSNAEDREKFQMDILREVVGEFRDRFEGNEWVKTVLANL